MPSKHRLTFNGLHCVICQKSVLFITTAVRATNPTYGNMSIATFQFKGFYQHIYLQIKELHILNNDSASHCIGVNNDLFYDEGHKINFRHESRKKRVQQGNLVDSKSVWGLGGPPTAIPDVFKLDISVDMEQ
jgi:hypothetical protein